MTIRWFSLLTVVVLVEVINFYVLEPQIVNDPLWSEQIAIKCPKANLDHAYAAKSMLDNGNIGIGFGAYLGVIFHSIRSPGLLTRRLSDESFLRRVLRILFCCVLSSPLLWLATLKAE